MRRDGDGMEEQGQLQAAASRVKSAKEALRNRCHRRIRRAARMDKMRTYRVSLSPCGSHKSLVASVLLESPRDVVMCAAVRSEPSMRRENSKSTGGHAMLVVGVVVQVSNEATPESGTRASAR